MHVESKPFRLIVVEIRNWFLKKICWTNGFQALKHTKALTTSTLPFRIVPPTKALQEHKPLWRGSASVANHFPGSRWSSHPGRGWKNWSTADVIIVVFFQSCVTIAVQISLALRHQLQEATPKRRRDLAPLFHYRENTLQNYPSETSNQPTRPAQQMQINAMQHTIYVYRGMHKNNCGLVMYWCWVSTPTTATIGNGYTTTSIVEW